MKERVFQNWSSRTERTVIGVTLLGVLGWMVYTYKKKRPSIDVTEDSDGAKVVTPVIVREIQGGTQGLTIYPSSKALLSWLQTSDGAPDLKGAGIMELGCGCGALAFC